MLWHQARGPGGGVTFELLLIKDQCSQVSDYEEDLVARAQRWNHPTRSVTSTSLPSGPGPASGDKRTPRLHSANWEENSCRWTFCNSKKVGKINRPDGWCCLGLSCHVQRSAQRFTTHQALLQPLVTTQAKSSSKKTLINKKRALQRDSSEFIIS